MKTAFDNIAVKLYRSERGKAIAYGSITIDDSIVIRINLYQVARKDVTYPFIISWPSVKNTKGEYKDQVFPVTAKAREEIYQAVNKAFKQLGDYIDIQDTSSFHPEREQRFKQLSD